MKFEQSYTGHHSKNTPAEEIFAGWDVLWEYNDSEDIFSSVARFFAKKDEEYCIGNYKMHGNMRTDLRFNPMLVFNTDGVESPRWSDGEKVQYLRNSIFFKNINDLVEYAKDVKRVWKLDGSRENDTRLQILLAIKKEYLPILEYRKKYNSRTRLDMVEE